jgi:hypothetical protein
MSKLSCAGSTNKTRGDAAPSEFMPVLEDFRAFVAGCPTHYRALQGARP